MVFVWSSWGWPGEGAALRQRALFSYDKPLFSCPLEAALPAGASSCFRRAITATARTRRSSRAPQRDHTDSAGRGFLGEIGACMVMTPDLGGWGGLTPREAWPGRT